MKKIESKIIGELIEKPEFEDWFYSTPIEIPFFENKAIPFLFIDSSYFPVDEIFFEEADNAIKSFLSLKNDYRIEISNLVHENCMIFLKELGYHELDDKLWKITDSVQIWNHVFPYEISVERRQFREKDIYVRVLCECDWDRVRDLQLVFRRGKMITRISAQDDHVTEADAYAKPDDQDKLLSLFNNE